MSYWEDPLFRKYYRKWQKRKYRKKLNIDVLQQALTEYYETQDSVKLVSGKEYTPTPTNNLNRNVTTEKVEGDKAVDEDPTIMVCGVSMKNSKWKELMAIQKVKGVKPTATPDQELFLYLKSLFKDD